MFVSLVAMLLACKGDPGTDPDADPLIIIGSPTGMSVDAADGTGLEVESVSVAVSEISLLACDLEEPITIDYTDPDSVAEWGLSVDTLTYSFPEDLVPIPAPTETTSWCAFKFTFSEVDFLGTDGDNTANFFFGKTSVMLRSGGAGFRYGEGQPLVLELADVGWVGADALWGGGSGKSVRVDSDSPLYAELLTEIETRSALLSDEDGNGEVSDGDGELAQGDER